MILYALKEEKARRQMEERERKEKAEQKFKEWITSIKDKDRHKRQPAACKRKTLIHRIFLHFI